jgi:hypothetical protein
MRKIFKFTILTIFSSLFLMPMFVSAQNGSTDSAKPKTSKKSEDLPANSSKSKNSKIEFPDIEGWEKSEIRKYPTAELGYSIAYQSSAGGMVTIYVYNGGQKNISSDISDKTLKNEIERAKNDIIQIGKAGVYEDVKEVKSGTITLGGTSGKVKALHSLFNFSVKGQDVDSEIYLFGYQNNFIKIRATRPKSDGKTENKEFANLLAEIDTMFSN